MSDIERILDVERLETDLFRGQATPTLLTRTFGGQVAGQALVSAVRTVNTDYMVHSLHGYFLRPGNVLKPIVYLVDRVRDGRSFTTRRVTGIQDGQAIFTMSASFHVREEPGITHQDTMPVVPLANELPESDGMTEFTAREWSDWDIRTVPRDVEESPNVASPQQIWMRYRNRLPDDPIVHICSLAYMSDIRLLSTASVAHPGVKLQLASLDHALWFMRPFRIDEWLLYDQTSPSAGFGRALTQGRIYDHHGNMVAAVTQEGLTRIARETS